MMHGTYVGTDDALADKTAILMDSDRHLGEYLAQFDDVSTGLGYGWHRFPVIDFELDKPAEWN